MARANLELARLNFERKHDDEFQLNLTAYHVQQAIELMLKHEIELRGEVYRHTHDITDLLEGYDFFRGIEGYEDLVNFSPKITEFEANTRYDKSFLATAGAVQKAFDFAEVILKFVTTHEIGREDTVKAQIDEMRGDILCTL